MSFSIPDRWILYQIVEFDRIPKYLLEYSNNCIGSYGLEAISFGQIDNFVEPFSVIDPFKFGAIENRKKISPNGRPVVVHCSFGHALILFHWNPKATE